MEIDRAVAALFDRLVQAGIELPTPAPAAAIRAVEDAISPLLLPEQLRAFWNRVDPATLRIDSWPSLCSLDFAVESWRENSESPGLCPRCLFPLAYSSHHFLLVELKVGAAHSGAVLCWGFDEPFTLICPSLADWLQSLAEAPATVIPTQRGDLWLHTDADLPIWPAEVTSPYGVTTVVQNQLRNWPEHWLASSGIELEAGKPRGATLTIAELIEAVRNGEAVSATIAGRVVELASNSSRTVVVVDDGTARTQVSCPTEVCTFGPTIRTTAEFDVIAEPGLSDEVRFDDVSPAVDAAIAGAQVQGIAPHLYLPVQATAAALGELLNRAGRVRATAVRTLSN